MNLTCYQRMIDSHRAEFETFFKELISYNDKVNLTAITDKYDVFTKHFLDSVLAVDLIPEGSTVVDIGTGAGFPCMPLKIVRPDIKITAVDSLKKRVNFLDLISNKLNLNSINVHSRAEEFAKQNREKFDIAVARAVAKLNTLLEYLMPLVKVGGLVIAYKGNNYLEELAESKTAIELLGGKYIKALKFNLPNEYGERNLIIIEEIKPTPTEFPRGRNLPKTKPIL